MWNSNYTSFREFTSNISTDDTDFLLLKYLVDCYERVSCEEKMAPKVSHIIGIVKFKTVHGCIYQHLITLDIFDWFLYSVSYFLMITSDPLLIHRSSSHSLP